LSLTNGTGTKTFTGAVTVNGGGTWSNSGNSATSFENGITMNGANFDNGTGAAAFITRSQALLGSGNMTFGGTVTPASTFTLTNSNSGTVTISSIVLTGNFTQGLNSPTLALTATAPFSGAGTFNASTNANTVNYTGSGQTVKAVTYKTLGLSGNGAVTMTGVTTIGTNFNMSGSVIATPVITTVGGNISITGTAVMTTGANNSVTGSLTVGTGATLSLGGFSLSIGTTSSITGTVNTVTSATGIKTFTGAVTINLGGVWDLSGQNPATSFGGGITMSGTTFNNGTGAAAFSANQLLAGANAMTFGGTITPAASTTLTNNNTGTVTVGSAGSIVLTGNFSQGANSTLSMAAVAPFSGAGTFSASANPNTVTYTGASPAVIAATYHNLTINGSGTATIGGTTVVNGTMTVTSATTNNSTLTVATALSGAGTLTQGTGSTLNIAGTSGVAGLDASTNANTVNYNATSGGQIVKPITYSSLTLGNTSGSQTAGGALTVNGTLTTTSGGTLDMVTYQLLGSLTTITNGGTIQTQNTSSTPIPTGKTWGGTAVFNGSSSQTIPASTFNNLTLNNSSGASLGGAVGVDNNLVLTSGKLTTSDANLISVTNTATSAVSAYSSSEFIVGPLQWSLSTGNYLFPLGKGTTKRPFTLNT